MASNSVKITEAAQWKPMEHSVPNQKVDPVRSARKYAGRLVENQEHALENLRFIRRNLERDELRASIIQQKCASTFPSEDLLGLQRQAQRDADYQCVRASDLQHEKMPARRPNADIDIRQLRSQMYGKDGVMWIPDSGRPEYYSGAVALPRYIYTSPRALGAAGRSHHTVAYASRPLRASVAPARVPVSRRWLAEDEEAAPALPPARRGASVPPRDRLLEQEVEAYLESSTPKPKASIIKSLGYKNGPLKTVTFDLSTPRASTNGLGATNGLKPPHVENVWASKKMFNSHVQPSSLPHYPKTRISASVSRF